jgi:hypothetical protein
MVIRGRTLALALGLQLATGILAPAAYGAPAAATEPSPQERPELFQDQPPPTLWDKRGEAPEPGAEGAPPNRISDNQGLLLQVIRTIVALCGVLFLMWALARVVGPRLTRALGAKNALGMAVVDRLSLDGRTTLVRVQAQEGHSYLIACGDVGIKLIDKLPAATASAPPFGSRMGAPNAPEE